MKLDLADDLPAVLGDRVELQQVILNLLTNGADARDPAASEPPELVVRSKVGERGGITVAVQDRGVGLDPRDSDRVFDPFVTTKPDHLGMGLAICRSIIAAHGGKVWASPNTGPGATFQFTLPRIQEGAP